MFYAVAASLIIAAVILTVLGFMSKKEALPRNWLAGTRLPATMRDDASWVVAQKTGWQLYLVNSFFLLVNGVGLAILVWNGASDTVIAFWVLSWSGCVLIIAAIQAVRSNRAAKRSSERISARVR